jgi:hypothetical protein
MTTIASMRAAYGGIIETKDDIEIQEAINDALSDCASSRWGDELDRGVRLLAVHFLIANWQEEAAVVSSSIPLAGGSASGGFGGGASDLESTTYGRQWIRLRKRIVGYPIFDYDS